MQHRKMKQFVQLRIVPFLVAAILTVSPLSLCASAAVWEGDVTLRVDYWGSGDGIHYQMNQGTYSIPISSNFSILGPKGDQTTNGLYFYEGVETWSKPVDVYMSGYVAGHSNYIGSETVTMYGDPYDRANYEVTYRGTHGGEGEVVSNALVELSSFTPNETLKHGQGISIRAGWAADEVNPISELKIRVTNECGWKVSNSPSANNQWIVTSVRLISSDTTAELDELSNVANQIIAGNEILEAMKGDVVALLQQIYTVTGDISVAVTQTTSLLNTLLEYVDGIEGQLGNIYSTLSSFTTQLLRLLMTNNQVLIQQIQQSTGELTEILNEIRDLIWESDGGRESDATDKVEQGSAVQEDLGELQRPDYEDIDTNVGDYVDQFDGGSGESDAALSGFLGRIFESSMVTSMLMISLTFCMVAYVLYGKR